MSEHTSGYVERIVYRNEDNGYTVLELETDKDGKASVYLPNGQYAVQSTQDGYYGNQDDC